MLQPRPHDGDLRNYKFSKNTFVPFRFIHESGSLGQMGAYKHTPQGNSPVDMFALSLRQQNLRHNHLNSSCSAPTLKSLQMGHTVVYAPAGTTIISEQCIQCFCILFELYWFKILTVASTRSEYNQLIKSRIT
jgi:hypothetical protein